MTKQPVSISKNISQELNLFSQIRFYVSLNLVFPLTRCIVYERRGKSSSLFVVLSFGVNFLISFNPDLSSLSVDEVETLSKEGFLKAVTVLLPLYVQYDGELCDLIIPFQNYDYPLCGEWNDIIHELLNLHKLVNNELPNRDLEHLWNEAFSILLFA